MENHYKLVARANIVGITSDEGLKALDGYCESEFVVADDRDLQRVFDIECQRIKDENPAKALERFECFKTE